MDYRSITNKNSKQYKLISNKVITVSDDGLLRNSKGSIAVALSSRYGNIGDEFLLTFENGKRIYVIKADEKQEDQLVNNCYHPDGSIVEVICDISRIGKNFNEAKVMGDFNYSDLFNGEIINIEKIIKEE